MVKGPIQVAAYVRVSTADQADSGLGTEAQRQAIKLEAERREWSVTWFVDNGYSGADAKRPALRQALIGLSGKVYDALVVAKLDRLSRTVVHFAGLVERAQKERWSLIALDLGVDTSTANGRMMARLLSVLAEWERDLISQRTRDALTAAKSRGVHIGRSSTLPTKVVREIKAKREAGLTFQAIADDLNRSKVATGQRGRQWWPSTVRAVYQSAKQQKLPAIAR